MKKQVAVTLGLMLVSGATFAKSPTVPALYELDVNGDGSVTRAELSASGSPDLIFGRIDTDRDGRIGVAEYKAGTARG